VHVANILSPGNPAAIVRRATNEDSVLYLPPQCRGLHEFEGCTAEQVEAAQ
jgi:hypothetical protein